ncbi:hypothetical protein VY88_31420 [Azospirillum thiophilum]|uniref:S41 family peptidase n=1 Tax=Azospirillum thiophilum TaxID=528244 RepID=UPI0005EF5C21|nr:S41 family peptidase [Azospirillum thiophilum]KJR61869.1 hypothetical protein VY88_31420 [Azospirillum thiophilum]
MLNYLATPLLAATRGTVMEPDAGTRNALCDALRFALENYYVHLPQKRAGFAIDPVQALQLLKESDGIRFSRRLLSIISSLHDRHTTLRLAPPWSGLVAYVPFLLEQYFENGHPRYIVTKRFFGFEEIPLGVEVTHWNGVPIHLYLENLAAETQGAHWSAQMRLALSNLTIRPLAFMLRPSEDWVALTYVDPWGKPYTATTPWRCYASQPEAVSGPVSGAYAMAQGVDYKLLATGAFLRDAGRTTQPSPTGFASQGPFRHGRVPTPAGEAGYLRIFTFQSDAPAQFAATAAGILASLPQERLIVDIRGNPGGNILAGQKLVALLAGGRIPGMAPIAFRNTAQTLALTTLPPLAPWHPSIRFADLHRARILAGLQHHAAGRPAALPLSGPHPADRRRAVLQHQRFLRRRLRRQRPGTGPRRRSADRRRRRQRVGMGGADGTGRPGCGAVAPLPPATN